MADRQLELELGSEGTGLPGVPVDHAQFINYVAANPETPISDLVEPYLKYEDELRKFLVRNPEDAFAAKESNLVPVFDGQEENLKTRARNLDTETGFEKQAYILPLTPEERKASGSVLINRNLGNFKYRFRAFSEGSLEDLGWSNVVVAGASVAACLLSSGNTKLKAELRDLYNTRAPASDVDLYLYGLSDKDALKKLKQIDKAVRGVCLFQTTVVRTRNAIVIASQHPVRHVTIHLRVYKSVTEVLSTFDVDCSCLAFDGKQVWATPRAVAAWMTQRNTIDPRRSSPFLEKRLIKYRHMLGFEIYFRGLDRSRIDPRVHERDISATGGLARLLIWAKCYEDSDALAYEARWEAKRRQQLSRNSCEFLKRRIRGGKLKDGRALHVAEWVDAEHESIFHTFAIPYGPGITASDIENSIGKEDILLNGEPKKQENREARLHRHPAFCGATVKQVIGDCCGDCPKPANAQEEMAAERQSEFFVSGSLTFIRSESSRQESELFHPRQVEQYTKTACLGIVEPVCQAIANGDLEHVKLWLAKEGNNVNGRDSKGRTPLHLAVLCSRLETVRYLLDHGAQLIARMEDGRTAMHIACIRGDIDILSMLLQQSRDNKARFMQQREAREIANRHAENMGFVDGPGETVVVRRGEDLHDDDDDSDISASWIYLDTPSALSEKGSPSDRKPERDFFDINAPLVQYRKLVTLLHLAILYEHKGVVKCLVEEFGADLHLPLRTKVAWVRGKPWKMVHPLVLAFRLPLESAREMTRLLIELGASSMQMVDDQLTALQGCIAYKPAALDTYFAADPNGAACATATILKKGKGGTTTVSTPLLAAIEIKDTEVALKLLNEGARAVLPFEACLDVIGTKAEFDMTITQPIILAVDGELPSLTFVLIRDYGVDCNTLTPSGWKVVHKVADDSHNPESLLDRVCQRIKVLTEWLQSEKNRLSVGFNGSKLVPDDSFCISSLAAESYVYNTTALQFDEARQDTMLPPVKSTRPGQSEKFLAVQDLLSHFESLEGLLHQNMAQTFRELHPDVTVHYDSPLPAKPREQKPHSNLQPSMSHIFRVPITERHWYQDHRWRNATYEPTSYDNPSNYVELFEAVWQNDIGTVKRLTLRPRPDFLDKLPLSIAVVDSHQDCPLTIALCLGHYELARTIFRIADAQYEPLAVHMDFVEPESDDESVGSDDFAESSGEAVDSLVDDVISIEDVRKVDKDFASHHPPALMLSWPLPKTVARQHTDSGGTSTCSERQGIRPRNVMALALHRNDLSMLSCIVDLAATPTKPVVDRAGKEVKSGNTFALDDHAFRVALQSAHPTTLTELIKLTAAGLPLDELARESGGADVLPGEEGKYQGLKGQKDNAKEKAAAARRTLPPEGTRLSQWITPPLLQAAYCGSIENLRWLMSDATVESYLQFATDNPNDERVKQISRSPRGFKKTVTRYLESRSKLAILACAMSSPSTETQEILKHLIEVMPEGVNARSSSKHGHTPLLVAVRSHNLQAVKALIEAGADQTACDARGKNVLHHMLELMYDDHDHPSPSYKPEPAAGKHYARMRKLLDLLDPALFPVLFTQRAVEWNEERTPLASWIERNTSSCCNGNSNLVAVARVLLEYSKGLELHTLDDDGRTPLETLISTNIPSDFELNNSSYALATLLLDYCPELAVKENISGATPLEIVEAALLEARSEDREPRREHAAQEGPYRKEISIIHTPESSFVRHSLTHDEYGALGGREAADLILSGAIDPSPCEEQRLTSLWKLLIEQKETLAAEEKPSRVLATAPEVLEATTLKNKAEQRRRKIKQPREQRNDGYLGDTRQWL